MLPARALSWVYDVATLSWVRGTQPLIDATNSNLYLALDDVETYLANIAGRDFLEPADTLTAVGTITNAVTIAKTVLTGVAPTLASVGVSNAQAVAANASRKGLHLVNTSVSYISLGFGATAVLYSGVTLNPLGGTFWMDTFSYTTGAVNAIASGAASNLGVTEFT